jgi:hypothetical protein
MYRVLIQCDNIPEHRQEIHYDAPSLEDAQRYAGLLDGSSPLYKYPPREDPDAQIGRCGLCGSLFTCTVQEPT